MSSIVSVAPTVLTPAVRPYLPFPRAFAALLAAAVVAETALSLLPGRPLWELTLAVRAFAALCACGLGSWVEDRIYTALHRTEHTALRLLVAVALPPLAALGGVYLAIGVRELGGPYHLGGALALSAMVGGVWMASSGLGSLLILVLDRVVSRLVADLRSRITLATLGLLVFSSSVALVTFLALPEVSSTLLQRPWLSALLTRAVADAMPLQELAFEYPEALQGVVTALALLVATPAVLSACRKLAEAVMERIHPLARGFDAISRGDTSVRVQEAGSSDFIQLSRSFNRMAATLTQARHIERALGVYLGPQLAEQIRRSGTLNTEPRLKLVTVFFADIRGYTTLSERLTSHQVLSVLNRYFEQMVPLVDEQGGYLDKFVGDAMLVVFNGLIDQPDHVERAVRCAIRLQERTAQLNREGAFPEGTLEVGIGVATGYIVLGNVGAAQKMDYTVVGDTVNLASRLTSQAAPGEIWVNELTSQALPPSFARERLDALRLKGKDNPIVPYRVWPTGPAIIDATTGREVLIA